MASPTRGRRESTGSQEGGTEASGAGSRGQEVAGAAGLQLPSCPAAYAECGWLGTLASLPLLANGTQERDLTRILRDQWRYRGGGGFLTTHLALGKTTFKRSCGAKFWRAGRSEAEGAAASPRAAPGGPGSPRGARRTSPGAGSGAGPGLVVERLLIHHGGRGGRCPSLSSAGAGAGSRVLRLRSPSAVHGSHLRGEAESRGGVPGM